MRVGAHLVPGDEPNWSGAFELCRQSMTPGPMEKLREYVGSLMVRTKQRDAGELGTKLTIETFARILADYPHDVALDFCKTWPRTNKWFPSESDVREHCEPMVEERRMIFDAVEGMRIERPLLESEISREPDPPDYEARRSQIEARRPFLDRLRAKIAKNRAAISTPATDEQRIAAHTASARQGNQASIAMLKHLGVDVSEFESATPGA